MRQVSPGRRLILKAGMVAGSLFLPVPWAWVWAQSEGTLKLLKLPKIALVLGNGNYKHGPLGNPANDARAISEVLKTTGFDVTLRVDAGRADMAEAVQAYSKALASSKGVGLFYYAGHGIQLAWRNYMLPVDAEVRSIADIQKQGVEVNALLEGITKASNAMNIIILDACRNNPFGNLEGASQKGLSQMDAPNGTLLAYATSPGNVASDGEGSNGLYTENLLREIKVPEAKVEDVFKRVRLSVRMKSNGAQIPWESTSLEEDFWFVPPKSLAVLAEEEAERRRKEEQARLEKRLAEEEAERKRRQEQALLEARRAEEQAERQRQQQLAALEQKRIADEIERKNKLELAIKEAQRIAEETERERIRAQALREAQLAEEEAARKFKQELELREKQRAQEEAERRRKEEQALREARLAEEEAARRRKQELAALEQQRIKEEQERRQSALAAESIKLSEAEKLRQHDEEAAIWDKARASKDPLQLQGYLHRYPSGAFSELAQLELDRALAKQGEKKIEIVNAAENPFTKGSAKANTNFKVGDSYTIREVDRFSRVEIRRFTRTVAAIVDDKVEFDNGSILDLLGNTVRFADGRYVKGLQTVPLEYSVGRRWKSRFIVTFPNGTRASSQTESAVITREKVTVPAGTFNAFRIQNRTTSQGPRGIIELRTTLWMVPDEIRQWVAREEQRVFGGREIFTLSSELVEYKQL